MVRIEIDKLLNAVQKPLPCAYFLDHRGYNMNKTSMLITPSVANGMLASLSYSVIFLHSRLSSRLRTRCLTKGTFLIGE